MHTFAIFIRERAEANNGRMTWHKIADRRATGRPDALRRYGLPVHSGHATCSVRGGIVNEDAARPVDGIGDGIYTCERTDRINFYYIDTNGEFIDAPTPTER